MGNPTLGTGDIEVRDRLTAAGYTVRVLDDAAASPVVAEDLVVISSSVSSCTVADTYRQTPVPILLYKPWIYDDMGLAGAYGTFIGSSVGIVDSTSPLAAGLSGTVSINTVNGPFGWGDPAASADIIATTSAGATLFAYDTGDVLVDGSEAASCRVALPFSHQTLANATGDGVDLLDAAIAWAGDC